MKYQYDPKHVCAQKIYFEIDDGIVHGVSFLGGCNGNLKAISKLVDGMEAEKVTSLLKGNTCGYKNTSCADQFAVALEKALAKQA